MPVVGCLPCVYSMTPYKIHVHVVSLDLTLVYFSCILPGNPLSVFYLFRHLTSKRAELARLGGELGGKL